MTKTNISNILMQDFMCINDKESIEVIEAPDPIEVIEKEKAQPIVKAIDANVSVIEPPTPKRINKGVRVAQSDWSKQISELEVFFNSIDIPSKDIRLSPCEVITDAEKFITSHFEYVKRYNGNNTFEPYLMRLEKLKDKLSV